MSEQQQPPLPQGQLNQQQLQTVALTNPTMPTTAFVVSPGNNVPLQYNTVVPPTGYAYPVPIAENPTVAEKYLSRQSIGLGIALIITGVLAIIFNIVGFSARDIFAVVGHGFWCGSLFIINGVLGIVAKSKQKCIIVAFMAFSIVSAVFTIALLAIGVLGALVNGIAYRCYSYNGYYSYRDCRTDSATAMEALLAAMAVLAAILSIWSSVICCRAICCCASTQTSVVVAPYGNQQMMFVNQQQPGGPVQYVTPQMMPMTFYSPADPSHSSYPHPPQYEASAPSTQPGK